MSPTPAKKSMSVCAKLRIATSAWLRAPPASTTSTVTKFWVTDRSTEMSMKSKALKLKVPAIDAVGRSIFGRSMVKPPKVSGVAV